jgi:hypothetical protein
LGSRCPVWRPTGDDRPAAADLAAQMPGDADRRPADLRMNRGECGAGVAEDSDSADSPAGCDSWASTDSAGTTARTTMAAGCSRIAATIKRVATTTNCRATRDGDRENMAMVSPYRHERHYRRGSGCRPGSVASPTAATLNNRLPCGNSEGRRYPCVCHRWSRGVHRKVPENTRSLTAKSLVETGIEVVHNRSEAARSRRRLTHHSSEVSSEHGGSCRVAARVTPAPTHQQARARHRSPMLPSRRTADPRHTRVAFSMLAFLGSTTSRKGSPIIVSAGRHSPWCSWRCQCNASRTTPGASSRRASIRW